MVDERDTGEEPKKSISDEKLGILRLAGNTLVTANPGTGKTLLLALKFANLIRLGVKPDDILCLTFTNKAKSEMEQRIIDVLRESGLQLDLSRLHVFTFHSYALNSLGDRKVVSANLLRFIIYKYFTDSRVLNYGEEYVIDTIVPKMENLIRYLKSFRILPEDIDVVEVKKFLAGHKNVSKEEMDRFAEIFLECYSLYEREKSSRGIDYADMLIDFLKMQNKPRFKYVLVDELQDLSELEADIALDSGETFFAVGDKKQAIFGFQGGSIANFGKFHGSNQAVLSENYRSSDEILNYAKNYFIANSGDSQHKADLKDLKNVNNKKGRKPRIYDASTVSANGSNNNGNGLPLLVCELASKLLDEGAKVAIISRTNGQILSISKELDRRRIDYSSTYFSASDKARRNVIDFIRGLLSNGIADIRNSLFTPFSPLPLRDVLELSKKRTDRLTLEDIYGASPEFKEMREGIRSLEDLGLLFKTKILPVSVTYGREYFLAVLNIKGALEESTELLQDKGLDDIVSYLKASDPLTDESEMENNLVLTTVHKAKGREFGSVIYAPLKTRDQSNFQDLVVKGILKTKGISVDEELDEESLRVDFVAFTRARDDLHLVVDRPESYQTAFSERGEIQVRGIQSDVAYGRYRDAFNLFVSGSLDRSRSLLQDNDSWITEFIRKHFDSLDHISFSSLNYSAEEYLVDRILRLESFSPSADLGTRVHEIAKAILNDAEYQAEPDTDPFAKNALKLMEEIRRDYPEKVAAEFPFRIPLSQLIGTGGELSFVGVMDAVFKKGNSYLIVDWKTDRKDQYGSAHRQQLAIYRKSYSVQNQIPIENIRVAIGYIGLRPTVDLGTIECRLDDKQPDARSFDTVKSHVDRILGWKKDPKSFLTNLRCSGESYICEAVLNQYEYEIQK